MKRQEQMEYDGLSETIGCRGHGILSLTMTTQAHKDDAANAEKANPGEGGGIFW